MPIRKGIAANWNFLTLCLLPMGQGENHRKILIGSDAAPPFSAVSVSERPLALPERLDSCF